MTLLDWIVVFALCCCSLCLGLAFTRRSAKGGSESYFAGGRSLSWWAIGLSNTATYSSGTGGFVMLVLVFGIAGNWMWWTSWIIWMPLVALIWARMWRRMEIVTTAEFLTLRYGGRAAAVGRRLYAIVMFCIAVLIIGYVTGFFAKTIAPLVMMPEWRILLIFGTVALGFTLMGGLVGVVYVEIAQFTFMILGSFAFLFLAVNHIGGWSTLLDHVARIRPEGLKVFPPTQGIPALTVVMLIVQGLFFAGSPTAGEGTTAQRFMAAKNERHAIGGQLFNAFLALSLRTIPLIGLGIIAMALFWSSDLVKEIGPAPAGTIFLQDPAYAWGELIKACNLPRGLTGLLVAVELSAYMSAMGSLLNWGASFVINDFYVPMRPRASHRAQLKASRLAVLFIFAISSAVAILFVKGMVGWFLFINSAMVIFLLPLAWFRFFWWRFNIWGEMAAVVLGLPLSIVIWFVLDFQNRPFWQGIGLLFLASLATLLLVTLLTPAESPETLRRFYARCRPFGLWGPVRRDVTLPPNDDPSLGSVMIDSGLGILACLGLVMATNAMFVRAWGVTALGGALLLGCAGALLVRYARSGPATAAGHEALPKAPTSAAALAPGASRD